MNIASRQSVLTSVDGPVITITINRPEVRNAIDRVTADLLSEAFVTFDADPNLSAAVLTGADGTFCAGADLHAIADGRGNRVIADMNQPGPLGPTRMLLSKPVIAAVEGHAVAGGLELAAWCDLRVASSTAIFGVYCRRWGVPLVDGGTIRLPRLIGQSHALDMILTGRGVRADEALQMGLANRVVAEGEALSAAQELALSIAKFPQLCVRSDRASTLEQWSLNLNDGLLREAQLGLATINSGETRAGASEFRDGRGRSGSFE
jgi:enoyl-CoA hydratase